ncbi:MAG: helix-hairpin-helix domain-containing protein [Myxococcota bacterium]|nr:helix-hairpin-helix domain-containing protein [Myxococcota bacterium]
MTARTLTLLALCALTAACDDGWQTLDEAELDAPPCHCGETGEGQNSPQHASTHHTEQSRALPEKPVDARANDEPAAAQAANAEEQLQPARTNETSDKKAGGTGQAPNQREAKSTRSASRQAKAQKASSKKPQAAPPEAVANPVSVPSNCIDIRTADAAQLVTLPGIGPGKAEKLIAFREKRGFKRLSELKRVKGIGPATFDKMKGMLCPF